MHSGSYRINETVIHHDVKLLHLQRKEWIKCNSNDILINPFRGVASKIDPGICRYFEYKIPGREIFNRLKAGG